MKMVILFTPRRLSSYNATFTLSAKKKLEFSILQHEFHFDQVELIYLSEHKRGGRARTFSRALDFN